MNLSGRDGARAWVDAAVERFGGVDILYNNASALRNGPLMELSDDDWHFTIKNELDIVWYSVRAAWPELVRRGGGSIVNVASIAARLGARFVGQVPHGSAKGGVLAMTKHLCAAGGPLGIRANAILPGLIYTPETARFIDDPDGPLPGILAKIPLGRYGHAARGREAGGVPGQRRRGLHHRRGDRHRRRRRIGGGVSMQRSREYGSVSGVV